MSSGRFGSVPPDLFCFVSYHTQDSNTLGRIVPRWAAQLQDAAQRFCPRAEFFTFQDPKTKRSEPDWEAALQEKIGRCDLFIAVITSRYLHRSETETIKQELEAARRRSKPVPELFWAIHVDKEMPNDPDADPSLAWVRRWQNSLVEIPLASRYDEGAAPSVPDNVVDDIVSLVKKKWAAKQADRVAPEGKRVSRTTPPSKTPTLPSALKQVFADVGGKVPRQLPAAVAAYKRSLDPDDAELGDTLAELAALIDEGADQAVIRAWISGFLRH
ncbi:MAG: toll/interleukin-1 receptor domain-containing protein [Bifidobacteriaceae bacterium]|jgi:hypothetical protein|nr:toll/interleukin-1 receptor domain-containing protein [Bifidobacteriaceae bacterium]